MQYKMKKVLMKNQPFLEIKNIYILSPAIGPIWKTIRGRTKK